MSDASDLVHRGQLLLALSTVLIITTLVVFIACPTSSAPLSDPSVLSTVCSDAHYKYLVPLLIPTGAYFVTANWVGWQYFRHG